MKKIMIWFTLAAMFLIAAGCSVRKGYPWVKPQNIIEIKFPKAVLEALQVEEIAATIADFGDVKMRNSDDIVYRIPEDAYDELLKGLRASIMDHYHALILSTKSPVIYEITCDGNFTVGTIVVDQQAFQAASIDNISIVANGALLYQWINQSEQPSFTLRFEDKATHKIFDTQIYP